MKYLIEVTQRDIDGGVGSAYSSIVDAIRRVIPGTTFWYVGIKDGTIGLDARDMKASVDISVYINEYSRIPQPFTFTLEDL